MSEDATLYAALEQTTRTLGALGNVLEGVTDSLNTHDRMFQNVEHNMAGIDGKVRTLETKVYAQEQDIAELRRAIESQELAIMRHSHPHTHPRPGEEP
jgi:septal ring factor EnvC (AmiA/AmiB activator)